jgi:glycosyltransferase involved in cell wall biosynthesis
MRHGLAACLDGVTPQHSEQPGGLRPPHAGAGPAPWLVVSDDWGRHPTSCQHLVAHLLPEQPVLWVNLIGTRRPRFDRATARRGLEKLSQWLRPCPPPGGLAANLRVVSPKVWPGFGRPWERRLNRAWLARQLRPRLAELPAAPVAVTTMPTAADLVGVLPVRHWVYYCVDDFSVWPGIDQAAARRLEDKLIDEADVLIAVSEALRERIAARGRTAHLLTHGVDLEFWSAPASRERERPEEERPPVADAPGSPVFEGLAPPFVVFWGLIDRRMDVDFLRHLSAALTEGTIVLVGPEDNPDPALTTLPRAVRRPALPLAELPALAAAAAVLVMPYADAPVTRAMQPLKLKEYLATGRPVVVRDLPATRPWADCLDLAATPEAFAAAVRRRLAEGLPVSQRSSRARLAAESWRSKAQEFARLVRRED